MNSHKEVLISPNRKKHFLSVIKGYEEILLPNARSLLIENTDFSMIIIYIYCGVVGHTNYLKMFPENCSKVCEY